MPLADGFQGACNIVDGLESSLMTDPESVFCGKRMKNSWKNSAPWVYEFDPERIIIEEITAQRQVSDPTWKRKTR